MSTFRNDLLTGVAKERRNFESSDKIIDETRNILQNNYLMSQGEADFHINTLTTASNLYHRNPHMLAAAIVLFTEYSEVLPNLDQLREFIRANRASFGKLKNFRANNLKTADLYLRELIKYYRYVSNVRERSLARPVEEIIVGEQIEPGVAEIGDIEMIR